MLNRLTKSLNVELTKFFQKFKPLTFITKQAFSKARYRLKPSAFIALNNNFVESYYSFNAHLLYKNKYLLLAVDGSNYELPWTEEIVEEFGVHKNQNYQPKAMATGVKIWDLLNQLTVCSKLEAYKSSETAMFDEIRPQCVELLRSCTNNSPMIFVGDAYYPGLARFIRFINEEVDFVIRCKPTFCREVVSFMKSTRKQKVLEIDLKSDHRRRWRLRKSGLDSWPDKIKVKAVRIEQADGTQGCILTSKIKGLSSTEIKEIYSLRYGEEVSFYFDKIKSQTENFATKKAIGIYQEWYANLLCLNITQLLIEEAQKELDEEAKTKPIGTIYKINRSVTIGLIKDEIPKILFGHEPIPDFSKRMIGLIKRFKEPYRPGRSFPRQNKHNLKYHMNQRPVL